MGDQACSRVSSFQASGLTVRIGDMGYSLSKVAYNVKQEIGTATGLISAIRNEVKLILSSVFLMPTCDAGACE